jgi:hypothetical protein
MTTILHDCTLSVTTQGDAYLREIWRLLYVHPTETQWECALTTLSILVEVVTCRLLQGAKRTSASQVDTVWATYALGHIQEWLILF